MQEIHQPGGNMSARARTSEEQVDTAALLKVLVALRDGDFSARLPSDWTGIAGKVALAAKPTFAASPVPGRT